MMADVLTRAELDRIEVCEDCGEKHDGPVMWMAAQCHPRAGMAVGYERATGLAHMHCRACGQHIASIAVAETEPVPADAARH